MANNKLVTQLPNSDSTATLTAKIFDENMIEIKSLPFTAIAGGRYTTAEVTGLTGTKTSPARYFAGIKEGESNHPLVPFYWDGTSMIETPPIVVPASTGTTIIQGGDCGTSYAPAPEWPGGVVYQSGYENRGIETDASGDKVRDKARYGFP